LWAANLGYLAYESVASPGYGLDKSRLFGIVLKDLGDFPNSSIDGVIGIEEDVLAPQLFDDLFPRHQLASPLHQQEQNFRGDSFHLQRAP
jgi:hypothetical protein